jgi:uncharacterized membrane protein
MNDRTKYVATAALVAATYASLTIFLAPISYGPLQIRVAEALTVLPYLMPSAIWGLWLGCLLGNIYGGLGPIDILGGSAITLLAGCLTAYARRFRRPIFAPLPPVVCNAFGVSAYLQFLLAPPPITFWHLQQLPPYWLFVMTIGLGQLIACYGLGYPMLLMLQQKLPAQKD